MYSVPAGATLRAYSNLAFTRSVVLVGMHMHHGGDSRDDRASQQSLCALSNAYQQLSAGREVMCVVGIWPIPSAKYTGVDMLVLHVGMHAAG
jgi:hypothetical protein